MKFSEKLGKARQDCKMTQEELATKAGITVRTIQNYETKGKYPKKREMYSKLAEILGLETNYLLSEDEEFLINVKEKYGSRGVKQAKELTEEVTGLFAGGEMADEDLDVMMKAIQDAYWIAKENNKKYSKNK